MPNPESYSLKNMFADLAHFQKVMGQAQSRVRNPQDKARLGSLLDQLQKARTEAEKEVPGILKDKVQKAQKDKAAAEVLAQKISTKQAELKTEQEKELLAKKPGEKLAVPVDGIAKPAGQPGTQLPVPPALPEVRVDPLLGPQLRFELLKTYGGLTMK